MNTRILFWLCSLFCIRPGSFILLIFICLKNTYTQKNNYYLLSSLESNVLLIVAVHYMCKYQCSHVSNTFIEEQRIFLNNKVSTSITNCKFI